MRKSNLYSDTDNKQVVYGFSTIEMILCISLLGLVLSISSISYSNRPIYFNLTINTLKSDLRNIIVLAQDTSVSYKFKICNGNTSYVIENYKGAIVTNRKLEDNIYIGYENMNFNIGSLNRSGGSSNPLSLYIIDTSRKKAERVTLMIGTSRIHSYPCDYKLALLELDPMLNIE